MILIFTNKTVPNKVYAVNVSLSSLEDEPQAQFQSLVQPIAPLQSQTQPQAPLCKYPLNVSELFPYWLRLADGESTTLISLTKSYYEWLCCNSTDVNDLSLFRLEDLVDLEQVPDQLVSHLSNTYLNSLPSDSIGTYVSPEKIKNIIDNIKVNLYSVKGSEDSFKGLIEDMFGVTATDISVVYPKKYLLRLNGGRYEWMQNTSGLTKDYSTDIDDFYPQLTGSRLNYSVFNDNDTWQEFSYIVRTPKISIEQYEATIKPVLHPAGMKGFFETRHDISNTVGDNSSSQGQELSVFANYALYKLGSTASIGHTFGCSGAYGGVTGYPIYRFPSWDNEIYAKYYTGMTFGEINIGDFLYLSPAEGLSYPNSGLTC